METSVLKGDCAHVIHISITTIYINTIMKVTRKNDLMLIITKVLKYMHDLRTVNELG